MESDQVNPQGQVRMIVLEEKCPIGIGLINGFTSGNYMPCYSLREECLAREFYFNIIQHIIYDDARYRINNIITI